MSDWYWDNPPRTPTDPGRTGRCQLVGGIDPRPGHTPSTVIATFPTAPAVGGMAGGRHRRWVRIGRTECGCGWTAGRSQTLERHTTSDQALLGMHASHSLRQPRKNAA